MFVYLIGANRQFNCSIWDFWQISTAIWVSLESAIISAFSANAAFKPNLNKPVQQISRENGLFVLYEKMGGNGGSPS